MTHAKIESGFNTLFIENVSGLQIVRRENLFIPLNWDLADEEEEAATVIFTNSLGEKLSARFKGYIYLINEEGLTIDTISSERV